MKYENHYLFIGGDDPCFSKVGSEVLGGKGAGLAEMISLGLPVPPGVTISTRVCVDYMGVEQTYKKEKMVIDAVEKVVELFADNIVKVLGYSPLVSVRSGARVSMPGMMDTVLNVGLTTDNLKEWQKRLGKRAALDCYRRLISMYGNVVFGIPNNFFEDLLDEVKNIKDTAGKVTEFDADMGIGQLEILIIHYRELIKAVTGEEFPNSFHEQLEGAIGAVFNSWNSARAIEYRRVHSIPDDWGTAVNVQTMVFGNVNDKSCSGVLFTRNPSTGEKEILGEYLVNAQGEDVVAGIRTPENINTLEKWNTGLAEELLAFARKLEEHFCDMQDIEFTVEKGKLWMVQTRNGKRAARAAFKIAYDLVDEEVIDRATAVKRVTGAQFDALTSPQIDPEFKIKPDGTGIDASAGMVTGRVVFTPEDAISASMPCILVREETTPDDFAGMVAAVGILTCTGGTTSHAAVVARAINKACVCGLTDMTLTSMVGMIGGKEFKEGDLISIDGSTGNVWVGVKVPVIVGDLTDDAKTMLEWATEINPVSIRYEGVVDFETEDTSIDMLPEEGVIGLGTINMWSADTSNWYMQFYLSTMMKKIKGNHDLSGYLFIGDYRTKERVGDRETLEFFGIKTAQDGVFDADVADRVLRGQIKALELAMWSKAFKGRWTIILPDYADTAHYEAVKEAGWGIVQGLSKIGDLIGAEGAVIPDQMFEAKLTEEGVDLETFIAILNKGGQDVSMMPILVDQESLPFEVFGK